MIKKKSEMRTATMENVRGGQGAINFTYLMEKEESFDKLNMCAILEVAPGCSAGNHAHLQDAEIYYLLEGELLTDDNGTEKILHAGDLMYTGNGESHSFVNKGKTPAKILAIVIR